MAYQELITYIKKTRSAGFSDTQIQKVLQDGGWQSADIAEAFRTLSQARLSQELSKGEGQVAFRQQPRSVPQPTAENKPPSGEASGRPSLLDKQEGARPFMVTRPPKDLFTQSRSPAALRGPSLQDSAWGKQLDPSRRRLWAGVGIGIFLLIGAGAAGGWYYYWSGPQRAYTAMFKNMASLESMSYNVRIRVDTSPEAENVARDDKNQEMIRAFEALQPASMVQALTDFFDATEGNVVSTAFSRNIKQAASSAQSFDALPGFQNVQFEVRLSGVYEQQDDGVTHFSNLIDVSMQQEDSILGVGVEFRRIDGTYYFRIVELPLGYLGSMSGLVPFGVPDLTQYMRQWYSLKTQTLAELKLFPDKATFDEAQETEKAERVKDLIAGSDLFEVVSTARNSSTDGRSAYRYTLKPKKENIAAFLKEVVAIQQDRSLTKNEEQQYFDFINSLERADIAMWVDKKTMHLAKITVSIPNYSFEGITLTLDISFEGNEFNTAVVRTPSGSIPFDEEIKAMVGGSLGQARIASRDARRITDIKQLQLALELYFDDQGFAYPESLTVLSPNYIPTVPNDPSDNSPYRYSVHDSGQYYHIGGSLEQPGHTALDSDYDCNSLTGAQCPSGTFDQTTAFDGSDEKGCQGEGGRYCYDEMP